MGVFFHLGRYEGHQQHWEVTAGDQNLALRDAGVYTCSVTNIAGTAARNVRLEVRGKGVYWTLEVITDTWKDDIVTSSFQYPLLPQPAMTPTCKLYPH